MRMEKTKTRKKIPIGLIVNTLSSNYLRKYSSGLRASLKIKIHQWVLWVAKRLCVSLSPSSQMRSHGFIVFACSHTLVPHFSTSNMVCCPPPPFLFHSFFIRMFWQRSLTVSAQILLCEPPPPPPVLATKKHLVTTGDVRTYCHGNSAPKFGASTPILTISNQILGKAFGCALL